MSSSYSHSTLCEQIVDSSQIAVIFADERGIIRLWNTGAEAIFDFTSAEALGQSMDIIIPERHRARHWEGYQRVMQTGVTKYGCELLAVPALRKGGGRLSIEFNVAIVRSPDGKIVGIAATLQDVTARWERDKALRARLADLERKLKELEQKVGETNGEPVAESST